MTSIFWALFDGFAQFLVIAYPPILLFWTIMHLGIRRWRELGRRSYWVAGLAFPLISGPLLWFRPELFQERWWPVGLARFLGVVPLLLGVWVAREAARYISRRTLFGVAELEPHKRWQPLLRSGIYARTRNPVYLAHWLIILSAAMLSGYAVSWIVFILDVALLPLMTLTEEGELRQRYGAEYEDYLRSTPRFFPKWPW